jgi:hypothetical protein
MENLTGFFVVLCGLAAVLALISIWAPRKVWVKVTALVTTALFLPAAYVSLTDLLSRPKPIHIEWSRVDLSEATVLGASMKEDEAIYLWLSIAGLSEPRAYVMPWDRNMAQQLQDAQRSAEAKGNGVRMNRPFERSWDERERRFYAAPQPPRPDKRRSRDEPLIFEQQKERKNSDAG